MNNPFFSPGARPEELYTRAASGFLEMLQRMGATLGAQAPPDLSKLGAPLTEQFEQWLRFTQGSGPWMAGGFPGNFGAHAPGAAAGFGPVPLGPAAAGEGQRLWELLSRLTTLQGQLAAHLAQIARSATADFLARAAGRPLASAEDALRLYELWVECAEGAYAAAARREDYAQLQGELANASAALLVEQRRQAESLVRAFGLPTRAEVDALYAQLRELRSQLEALRAAPAAPRARSAPRPRKKARPSPGRRGR
ncbi:MAG: hypothetical protein JSS29_05540 [Proteobacteria bacterium]|nr:hypothetical protein [Pseudomonadota bacterium]